MHMHIVKHIVMLPRLFDVRTIDPGMPQKIWQHAAGRADVLEIELCNLWDQWIIRVAIAEQG